MTKQRTRTRPTRRIAQTAIVFLLAAVTVCRAQSPAFNRNVIVLDPAHGGTDIGAQISDRIAEKDVTLAFAIHLRSLLAARGFTVILTRENDTALATDQRAEIANRAHAVACLVLHASASGAGVHLDTSTLNPIVTTESSAPIPWDNAQATYLTQSLRLVNGVGAAVSRAQLPLVVQRAALRPLDNLLCPAISVELAPLEASGSDQSSLTDPSYQQRIGEALAGALIFWRNQAQPPVSIPSPVSPQPSAQPGGTP